jgi:hypothetical protein
MRELDYEMPALMKDLHRLEFDYADGDGMDFEPYMEFLSLDETELVSRLDGKCGR